MVTPMQWLKQLFSRAKVPPYRQLKLGLICEYSLIIRKADLAGFLARGWREAADFRDFHYRAGFRQTVVLSKPRTLSEIEVETLIGKRITGFSTYYGSYGMGGPGFFGLSLDRQPADQQIMVYAVWGAAQYTLLDDREIACSPRYYDERHPWLSHYADKHISNWDELSPVLIGCRIEKIDLTPDSCVVHLLGDHQKHRLEFVKNDGRLPRQGNGDLRKNAFDDKSISEYLVFQREDAVLWVC